MLFFYFFFIYHNIILFFFFFFSSRRRHTRCGRDWSSAVCSSDLPAPGWTLPGVYTLGGAQIALKHQGCAVGRRVAFVGTGPLLLLAAYQYAKAGATPAAIVVPSHFRAFATAGLRLLRMPRELSLG